jgi:hypothetical protein
MAGEAWGMQRNKYYLKFGFYGTQMGTQRINYKNKPGYALRKIVVYCHNYPGDMNRLCMAGNLQRFLMFGAKWRW